MVAQFIGIDPSALAKIHHPERGVAISASRLQLVIDTAAAKYGVIQGPLPASDMLVQLRSKTLGRKVSMETPTTPRYGLDAYLDWVQNEGLRVHEGWALDLFEVETTHWPRFGVNGAVAHLRGRGDFCNMFVLDIPAGSSTLPQRHLYEEVYYVLDGRGNTQLEFGDGSKRAFEWGPNSLFAIPLNAKYRHFNASGTQRALLCTTTLLPLMMKVLHNERFIFDNDFAFNDRIGKQEYFSGDGDLLRGRPGYNIWETNFIPDVATLELFGWADRGGRRFLARGFDPGRRNHARAHLGDRAGNLQEGALSHRRTSRSDRHRNRILALMVRRRRRLYARRLEARRGLPAGRQAIPPALRDQQRTVALCGDGHGRLSLPDHRGEPPHYDR